MPQGEHGRVLFTSRHADTDQLTYPDNVIELLGLSPESSLDLLFKKCHVKQTGTTEHEGSIIIERLGYHALAITQAGSYIRRHKIKLDQFMSHYDRQRRVILEDTHQETQCRRKLKKKTIKKLR